MDLGDELEKIDFKGIENMIARSLGGEQPPKAAKAAIDIEGTMVNTELNYIDLEKADSDYI